MKRIIVGLLTALLSWSAAHAASTINPNSPAQAGDLTSAPLRSNFLAAYTDINNILGGYAKTSAPINPTNLQTWVDTNTSPNYVFKYRNNQTSSWVPYGTLNVNTGVWTPYGSAAGFLATSPIAVSVSGGVVTYSLNKDANFTTNGSNQLALATALSGQLLANCSGGSAEPVACNWNTFANVAIGNTDGMIPYHAGGVWTTIMTGTSGATIPRLDTANTWSTTQTMPNPVFTGTMTAGAATFTGAFSATGLIGLGNLAVQNTNTVLANVTSGSASPTALSVASCVGPANALQWVTNTGFSCAAIVAAAGSVSIGGTLITGGTTTRVLYDNAGALGEYTITGTGTVVAMRTSPSLITPILDVATGTSLALNGATIGTNALAITGTVAISSTLTSAAHTVTSTSGSCIVAGPSGATNSTLNVDCGTVSSVAGLNIIGGVTGGPVRITLTDPAANTSLTINAKGTGTIGIGNTSTGAVTITPPLTYGVATGTSLALGGCTIGANALCTTGTAAISSTLTSAAHVITSASTIALAVGLNGSTNPAFVVDSSAASQASGLKILTAIAGGGVDISVIDSGSNSPLSINAKGTGGISIGNVSTGAITLSRATTLSGALTYGGVTLANSVVGTGSMVLSGGPTFTGTITASAGNFSSTLSSTSHIITSGAANALTAGVAGITNPAFNVDASTASSATGINVKSAAATGGVAISVTSSGTNENVTFDAKGSGTINFGATSTGAITLTRATTLSAALTYGGVTLANSVVGTGSMVLSTNAVLTTPNLGTPSAINLANATNLPISAIASLGTGVPAALAVAIGTTGGFMTDTSTNTVQNKSISAVNNTITLPYFAAQSNVASQSATTAVDTKIVLATEIADSNNWFDNVTNYRFTPQLAGKYKITGHVSGVASGGSLSEIDVHIYKNGAVYATSFNLSAAVVALSLGIGKTVPMNGTTDYVELWATLYGTGTLTFISTTTNPIRIWFEAQYEGP